MKLQNFLPAIVQVVFFCLSSCKNDSTITQDNEVASTIELFTNQAISDNLTEDANDVTMQISSGVILATFLRIENTIEFTAFYFSALYFSLSLQKL